MYIHQLSSHIANHCYVWLPGQQFVLQTRLSTESPKQRVPPFDGDGLLQLRVLLETIDNPEKLTTYIVHNTQDF
jgi:hypothetical protein